MTSTGSKRSSRKGRRFPRGRLPSVCSTGWVCSWRSWSRRRPDSRPVERTGRGRARSTARRPAPPSPHDRISRLVHVLVIDKSIYDAIVAHARRDHPDEACGVVAGPVGSDRPVRFVPMTNAARSPTFYEFDSADLLRLYREMDERGEEPVIIYHSHTATEAYPSRTDVSYASEPNAHYVLVSTRDPDTVEFRSFRIVDGSVTEEEVRVVPALDINSETRNS